MLVTIIGAGNMGRAIGTRAVSGGHDVEIVDRDPEEARSLAQELDAAGDGSARPLEAGGSFGGDVVVLALYYASVSEALEQYRDQLAGKIIVDVTNPVDFETWGGLTVPERSSAAQEIQQQVPEGTRVVKAFNTTFAGTLSAGEVAGQTPDVFVASDDDGAKATVIELIESTGLRALDAGALARARQLEELGLLHMALQQQLGTGFGSTVKIHP